MKRNHGAAGSHTADRQPGYIEQGICPRCGDEAGDDTTCTACGYVSGSSTGDNDAPPDEPKAVA